MIVIYDEKMPRPIVDQLEKRGFLLIKSKKLEGINNSLSSHPDLQVCKINNKKIVVEPSLYKYYKENLLKYGIIVILGKERVGQSYPQDTIYNLASNGKIAIHNFSITDKAVLEEVTKEGLTKVDVKQGYGKCNVLFTKTGLITSDKGIYDKVKLEKKLLIRPGFIKLENYSYGFVGGASGYGDNLYLLGDLKKHPDFEKIEKFLKDDQTDFELLGEDTLEDFGSLIFLEEDTND